jgi:hypothetical protein
VSSQTGRARCSSRNTDRGLGVLTAALKEARATERELLLTARLIGGNLVKRTFDLQLEDGTIHFGRVEVFATPLLEEFFGLQCQAVVTVIERQLPTGEMRETWLLRDLSAAE